MIRKSLLSLLLLLLPGIGFLLLTFGLPLWWALTGSIGLGPGGAGFTLDHLAMIVERPAYWRGLQMSLYYAITPTVLTLFIAVPLAMLLQQPMFGRKLLNGLYKIPLAVPGIIAAFMVLTMVEQGGFLDRILMQVGLSMPRIVRDEWGIAVVLTSIWKDTPFMALIITGAFGAIPSDMVPAARSLGASRLRAFLAIELPMAMPGITAAALLCFVKSLGSFAAPSILGPTYPMPLPVLMYESYREGKWAEIYAMGTVLIVAAFLVLAAYYTLTALSLRPGRETRQ